MFYSHCEQVRKNTTPTLPEVQDRDYHLKNYLGTDLDILFHSNIHTYTRDNNARWQYSIIL